MNLEFVPKLNPITLISKIGIVVLFWGLLVFGTISFSIDHPTELEIIIPSIFLFFFFGYMGLLVFYDLWFSLKIVRFDKDKIKIIYLLRLKTMEISTEQVRGYSCCSFNNGWNMNSLILYSKSNEVVEFINKNYIKYHKLSNYLGKKYCKIGDETLNPKFWIGRTYQFLN